MSLEAAESALKEGRPEVALAVLQDAVRAKPADAKLRVFLFQLLSVMGQWDRALNQLKVAGEMDASTLLMVQTYESAVRCEKLRAEVFAGHRLPLIMGQPEDWIAKVFQALQLSAQGHHSQAQEVREAAFEAAPTTAGNIDGTAFEWIADADPRIGPCLEIIMNGGYYWVPFARIREVKLDPPEDLRDLVWAPAHITWSNEGQSVAMIPVRYAGTEGAADGALRLSRKTEWLEQGEGGFAGLGQRLFATNGDEYPLLGMRVLTLQSEIESGGENINP